MKESLHILFSGGGTLGPVTPLLAVAEVWREMLGKEDLSSKVEDVEFSWVGTKRGPERALIEAARIPFYTLHAPKLDRHRWWRWPAIPFLLLWSMWRSWRILRALEPDVVMSAGGYVSVPLVIVARVMGMKVWIHQLDRVPGIANRVMAPFANRISVTLDESLESFSEKKRLDVGGVVRPQIWQGDIAKARERFNLPKKDDRLTVLLFGGGTGADSLNKMISVVGSDLSRKVDIIHLTGKGKMREEYEKISDRYVALEFLGAGMADAFALADIVIGRAGMGTIMELAALKKPSIIIPLHNTDQLGNAQLLAERDAAKVLQQINPQIFKQEVESFVADDEMRRAYSRRMGMLFSPRGAEKIVVELMRLLS
ncbi:UDP-N-acetylglucosamine--N-acetylmuramyl-(pentapeptide) pyrophosphoryl-undecaprenol N-acetylglucosamine transferase [Candidatus Uhrbacteria bacterium]|jgi:UDP-N-acetylglucosamine--N-acetylmuramyl-(pentapeptide) pyrophosphoryl-undecaprenol N-acetylglucosamine transferase|nr:UDP-N-acetylglucosamine--N-acetylmuramyl-(pentapeptide) pyrophosphoryl-undecaprenol N-acetylglucosamine transferase [Candidatus Uhrbacteria bacterium]